MRQQVGGLDSNWIATATAMGITDGRDKNMYIEVQSYK